MVEVFLKHHRKGIDEFSEKSITYIRIFSFASSNMTSGVKKQHSYIQQQQMTGQDFTNTCYQISGSNNNQNPMNYPPPAPGYGASMHQQGSNGAHNPAFGSAPGLFGYSRASSPVNNPMYPHCNVSSSRAREERTLNDR